MSFFWEAFPMSVFMSSLPQSQVVRGDHEGFSAKSPPTGLTTEGIHPENGPHMAPERNEWLNSLENVH